MPLVDVVLADEALHLLHFSLVGQDDHHGGVALVRQQDDRRVVVEVLIVVVATHPLHHVHLNRGALVHVEVGLTRQVTVERFLPLPCVE